MQGKKNNELSDFAKLRLARKDVVQKPEFIGTGKLLKDGYFGMSELLSAKTSKVNKKELDEMRIGTFKAVKEYMKVNKITDFVSFWNENVSFMKSDMNMFSKNIKFAKIAHMIEAFAEETKKPLNSDTLNPKAFKIFVNISFGIRASSFIDYVVHDKIVEKVKKGPPVKNNGVKYGTYHGAFDGSNDRVTCPKNPIYQQWELWCIKNEVKKSDALIMSMQSLMEKYPTDLPSLETLSVGNLDTREEIPVDKDKKMTILIEKNVYALMKTILKNYNDDIANTGKSYLLQSHYINNAINDFNKNHMPLKYSSPQAQREYEQMQREQAYIDELKGGVKYGKK